MRYSIFNVWFQLKKQNKNKVNKYTKGCTNTKVIYWFCYMFNNYKSKHRTFRKGDQNVPQKRFHARYIISMVPVELMIEISLSLKMWATQAVERKRNFLGTQISDRFKWKVGVLILTQIHILVYSFIYRLYSYL